MSNFTKVAVYGTLRKACSNHRLLDNDGATYVGSGIINEEYNMYSLGGFPAIIEGDHNSAPVRVEVYSVTDPVLESLNRLEGFVAKGSVYNFYDRKEVTVRLDDGSVVLAFTYYLTIDYFAGRGTLPPLITSGDWLQYRAT